MASLWSTRYLLQVPRAIGRDHPITRSARSFFACLPLLIAGQPLKDPVDFSRRFLDEGDISATSRWSARPHHGLHTSLSSVPGGVSLAPPCRARVQVNADCTIQRPPVFQALFIRSTLLAFSQWVAEIIQAVVVLALHVHCGK